MGDETGDNIIIDDSDSEQDAGKATADSLLDELLQQQGPKRTPLGHRVLNVISGYSFRRLAGKFRREKRYTPRPTEEQQQRWKKRKYALLAAGFTAMTAVCSYYSASNFWRWHIWDKYVIKQVEIAANVPSVGKNDDEHGLSMEQALQEARGNLSVSPLENPAIIWETPYTSVKALDDLLSKAVQRTQEIKQFQDAFSTGMVQVSYPKWVKEAHARLDPRVLTQKLNGHNEILEALVPTLDELAESEYGQRIGSEYEALNSVVAGGTRTSGKNLKEKHRSLLDTLDEVGGLRSIVRFQADDYKETFAQVFVGYLKANMGYLDEALVHLRNAKKVMDRYPDDKNLAWFRNTPELEQRTIKGLINSTIREWVALNKDEARYSTGWWKRLRYYNQSIGGQADPSIQDMAENINSRYFVRATWPGNFALGFLYLAGLYAKRLRKVKEYEVVKGA